MKLTALMLVRNEAGRYLREVLDDLNQYVDELLIVDDASGDATPVICESYAKANVIRRAASGFHDEAALRKFCWDEALASHPDWILALDADEVFEDRMKREVRTLMAMPDVDAWAFRLYDFWGSKAYYRDDPQWCAHHHYGVYLLRPLPVAPVWRETPIHCGRIPGNVRATHRVANSPIRLKHYGWANPAEHRSKYERYLAADPHGQYGVLAQYQSILDPNPHLMKWEE
ncbi:MAG TPA: glycosyltransferase [Symbiobacteriaceae bacterium]